ADGALNALPSRCFGPPLALVWIAAYWLAIWWYIKAKGREGTWIFAGFLNLIGLIILACPLAAATRD
ncbi:MAG: hypothetical protein KGO22_04585, partial [Gammaproteobacteria bacterium]|nr:hypothetical protein [Gammaproteobacteria bacterium]